MKSLILLLCMAMHVATVDAQTPPARPLSADYRANREQFLPRYMALLKNGFDAPPAALLKQFLKIDLLDGSLLSDDLDLLNRRLDQLEASASH